MNGNRIDGITLKEMIIAAATLLEANKQQLNDLNVFPVPDGDTGTNMSLTMKSVLKEVLAVTNVTVPTIAEALSRGALKGARGNSGVILSQLFRGLAKQIQQVDLIDSITFASAMRLGVDTAYKAVMKPKEGTILTVARVMAENAAAACRELDIIELMDLNVRVGEDILRKTPDMLPQLKKAGVVDAGGQGLLIIYTAFKMVAHGEEISENMAPLYSQAAAQRSIFDKVEDDDDLSNISFAYCTEFFVQNLFPYVDENQVNKLQDKLSRIGDSLVVVGDQELIKVHVHTNSPGKALQYSLMLGELEGIKIENMLQQNRELQNKKANEQKEIGVVAVASGEGLVNVFKDLGVDAVIFGGQTMNPSTEDISNEIKKINAKSIIILPNNSNIILAAQQAQEFSDKNLFVVPTTTVPQGIAAMLAYNPDENGEKNFDSMSAAFENVLTGLVTYAVRNTSIDEKEIHQGDILGLSEGEVCCSGTDLEKVALELILSLAKKMSDLITVYYGKDVKKEQAEKLANIVKKQLPETDVEVLDGGQPVYYYILSAE